MRWIGRLKIIAAGCHGNADLRRMKSGGKKKWVEVDKVEAMQGSSALEGEEVILLLLLNYSTVFHLILFLADLAYYL